MCTCHLSGAILHCPGGIREQQAQLSEVYTTFPCSLGIIRGIHALRPRRCLRPLIKRQRGSRRQVTAPAPAIRAAVKGSSAATVATTAILLLLQRLPASAILLLAGALICASAAAIATAVTSWTCSVAPLLLRLRLLANSDSATGTTTPLLLSCPRLLPLLLRRQRQRRIALRGCCPRRRIVCVLLLRWRCCLQALAKLLLTKWGK